MSLKHIKKLIDQKKNDQALREIEQLSNNDRLEGSIYQSIIKTAMKDFQAALSAVETILTKDEHQKDLILELKARIAKIQALTGLKDFYQVFEEIETSEQILNQLDVNQREKVKEWEGMLWSYKGGFQINLGDIGNAQNSFQKSLTLYEEINNKQGMYYQLNNIGWIYRVQGQLDKALDCFQELVKISEEIGEKKNIAWSNLSLGHAHFYNGDLNRAAEHARESLEIFEELKHERGIPDTYVLIGSIHKGRGDYTKSLEYYQKVLTAYNKAMEDRTVVPHAVCVSLREISFIRYYQNKIDETIEICEKALEIHESICKYKNSLFDFEMGVLNFWLIMASIELEDASQAEYYLGKLDQVSNRWPWLQFLSKAGEAMILKGKPRARDKIKAQQLLEEALENRFDYELEFILQVDLCELLLDELRLYREEEVIQEIQDLLTRISDIANKQRNITTLVILYSLQAKLASIEGNAELSNGLLTQALAIAEKKGLKLLAKKLVAQQNLLFKQLGEWKSILDANQSLQKKIEEVDLKNYITEAMKVREKFAN